MHGVSGAPRLRQLPLGRVRRRVWLERQPQLQLQLQLQLQVANITCAVVETMFSLEQFMLVWAGPLMRIGLRRPLPN